MFAGAADSEWDWLIILAYCLMGFCAALCFAMFGVGFVALWSLWKELARQLHGAKIGLLLVSSPLAVLWLGLGLGVFIMFGIVVEKMEKLAPFWGFLLMGLCRYLIWLSIATTFYNLWKGRSHAALMLRSMLMVSFSAIMIVAVAFGYWWIIGQTTPLLVLFISAIGASNVVFYTRCVRLTALRDNLLERPDGRNSAERPGKYLANSRFRAKMNFRSNGLVLSPNRVRTFVFQLMLKRKNVFQMLAFQFLIVFVLGPK